MGNEKSNSYWEAELPPNYVRVGNENFIRAKYDFGVTSTKLWNSPNPFCVFLPFLTSDDVCIYLLGM